MSNSRDLLAAKLELEYVQQHQAFVIKQYGSSLYYQQLDTAMHALKNVAGCIISDGCLENPDFEEYEVSRFCNDTLECNKSIAIH